jgi:hypothetical protein
MAMLVSKNFHGVVGAGGNNFNNFHQGFSPEKLRKYVLDFFLSPPSYGDRRKISSPGNLDGSFSCQLCSAFFCIFSFDCSTDLWRQTIKESITGVHPWTNS